MDELYNSYIKTLVIPAIEGKGLMVHRIIAQHEAVC